MSTTRVPTNISGHNVDLALVITLDIFHSLLESSTSVMNSLLTLAPSSRPQL